MSSPPEESPSSDSSDSPPPSSNDNSSPPPPSNDDTSPPPPSDSSSPPPPDSNSNSPPPPSNNNSSPPPSDNDNNNNDNNGNNNNNNNNSNNNDNDNSGSNNNNNNDNDNNGSNNNNNGNNNNNNRSPPPPRSSGNSNSRSPPPPPRPGSSSRNDSPNPQLPGSSLNDHSPSNENSIIIGASVGAGLLLLIMIVFLVACGRRKKRKPRNDMNYYGDNFNGNGAGDYYNSGPHGNWNNNVDHMVKILPPPSAQVSSEHNWQIAPPPPPPAMMSSTDLSSAGFSGPVHTPQPPPHLAMSIGFSQSSFTYEDLAAATGGFAQSNLLGQGGFGYVHKGILPNGKEVAVKSLKANSGQGEREFQAEVDIISRVHHRHLVSLVGYCIAGSQRMLVYEFVPNGTLEYHLHVPHDRPAMDWPTRLKIALGSAKGFAYLHEDCHPRIIHRDIKAANILLDSDYEAQVADFGLAKLSSDNYTHVSTRIMGTFGYLAPEYASSGKLTEKSDVYSYGIMLLELITGRRPVDMSSDDDGLVDWARPILMQVAEGGSYEELIDPRLEHNYDPHEMVRMVASAAACVRHSARRRPKMSQIVRALEGDVSLDDLNPKTAQTTMFGSSGSSSSYSDLTKVRKAAGLSSQDFTSGEHGTTGEYVRSTDSSEMHSNPSSHNRSPFA